MMAVVHDAPAAKASRSQRRPGVTMVRVRMREYFKYDSVLCRWAIAILGLLVGQAFRFCLRPKKAFRVFSTLHKSAYSALVSAYVVRWLKKRVQRDKAGNQPLNLVFRTYIEELCSSASTSPFFANPQRLIGTRILVLKSPAGAEKGAIIVDYSFVFPLLAKFFDIRAIAAKYHMILEPSWTGYCDPDILSYAQFPFPVFVQCCEPRDTAFLKSLDSNLIPVPVAGNWWVDHRIMRPLPDVTKDVDVIMVACWARYKRHEYLFAAMAKLIKQGRPLRLVLIGYPGDRTLADIRRLAADFGVADFVEFYERLSPEEVNYHFNRARANIVWSRKEGFNRTIIEGMFAGVSGILREGFNYGHPYDYINARTGCFASERALPQRLLSMVDNCQTMSPREWVMEHMSCQRATAILDETIGQVAERSGEPWSGGLAVKVCHLNRMRYWNESERERFSDDYQFLQSTSRCAPFK